MDNEKIGLMVALLCLLFCATASAQYDEVLNRLQGNWYNPQGQVVVSFDNGYINNCEIVNVRPGSGGKYVGGYYFTIRENAGTRELYIFVHLSQGNCSGYGKYIILENDGIRLVQG